MRIRSSDFPESLPLDGMEPMEYRFKWAENGVEVPYRALAKPEGFWPRERQGTYLTTLVLNVERNDGKGITEGRGLHPSYFSKNRLFTYQESNGAESPVPLRRVECDNGRTLAVGDFFHPKGRAPEFHLSGCRDPLTFGTTMILRELVEMGSAGEGRDRVRLSETITGRFADRDDFVRKEVKPIARLRGHRGMRSRKAFEVPPYAMIPFERVQ